MCILKLRGKVYRESTHEFIILDDKSHVKKTSKSYLILFKMEIRSKDFFEKRTFPGLI